MSKADYAIVHVRYFDDMGMEYIEEVLAADVERIAYLLSIGGEVIPE